MSHWFGPMVGGGTPQAKLPVTVYSCALSGMRLAYFVPLRYRYHPASCASHLRVCVNPATRCRETPKSCDHVALGRRGLRWATTFEPRVVLFAPRSGTTDKTRKPRNAAASSNEPAGGEALVAVPLIPLRSVSECFVWTIFYQNLVDDDNFVSPPAQPRRAPNGGVPRCHDDAWCVRVHGCVRRAIAIGI